MIERFYSLGDFARRAAQVPKGKRFNESAIGGGGTYDHWYGPLTYDSSVERCILGDNSIVPKAEAILAQIDAAVEVPSPVWAPSVYGAYPMVPEYLAGAPDPMRRMIPAASDVSPVSVVVATDPAAGVTHADMLIRGVAVIALVMKLSTIRPVKLTLLSENNTQRLNAEGRIEPYLLAVDINTQPLDLASACFAIAGASFARHLAFSVTAHNGHSVSWPTEHNTPRWLPYLHRIGLLTDKDLFIPAARYEDRQMYTAPIDWVNSQVMKYRGDL